MLITASASALHLPLYSSRSIQSMPFHSNSWRSILVLSFHLNPGLPSGLLSSGLPTKTLYANCPLFNTCHVHTHYFLLDLITRIIFDVKYRFSSFSLCSLLHSPIMSPFLDPKKYNEYTQLTVILCCGCVLPSTKWNLTIFRFYDFFSLLHHLTLSPFSNEGKNFKRESLDFFCRLLYDI